MSSSASPEPARAALEPRARLFALQVDLFVNAPARDRESIRAFEALALGFMPRLDPATLVLAAERLAACADTPAAVLDHLVRHGPATRRAVLERAPVLPPGVTDALIGLGRAASIAARPGLDAAVQARLLVLDEPAVDEALAGNARIALDEGALLRLVARAADRPLLARALLARPDLAPEAEAALYLAAGRTRRAAIRARLDDASDRPALPPVTDAERDLLLGHARAKAVEAFAETLSGLFGLPKDTPWRFLRRDRQDLLGLALAALTVGESAAAAIALSLHPAIAQSPRAAAAISETAGTVGAGAAAALVAAILGQPIRRGTVRADIRFIQAPDAAQKAALPPLGPSRRLAG